MNVKVTSYTIWKDERAHFSDHVPPPELEGRMSVQEFQEVFDELGAIWEQQVHPVSCCCSEIATFSDRAAFGAAAELYMSTSVNPKLASKGVRWSIVGDEGREFSFVQLAINLNSEGEPFKKEGKGQK